MMSRLMAFAAFWAFVGMGICGYMEWGVPGLLLPLGVLIIGTILPLVLMEFFE